MSDDDAEDELDEPEQDDAPVSDDPRTQPLRYSVLKAMKQSPAHARDLAVRDSDGPSLALRLGAGGHALVFGTPEVVVFNGQRRRSKPDAKKPKPTEWELFEKQHPGKVILNAKEYRHAKGIADAIRANDVARRVLLSPEAIREERIDWNWEGRAWRSTPDARNFRTLAELKTTRSADPEWFWRDALRLSYHVQLAIYRRAIEQTTGVRPRDVYLFAVESKPPYVVTPFMLTERSLEHGDRLAKEWHERFLKCEAENNWPGYTSGIEELDVFDAEEEAALVVERAMAADDGTRATVGF